MWAGSAMGAEAIHRPGTGDTWTWIDLGQFPAVFYILLLGIRMRIMPRARYVYNVHVIGKTQHEHVKGFD